MVKREIKKITQKKNKKATQKKSPSLYGDRRLEKRGNS